jgi:hypothetical protein
MKNLKLNTRLSVITGAILFGAFMRLIPHWPNFTPVAAIALFAGAHLGRKHLAFIIPMAAMLLSDIFLGFHPYMLSVYLSFAGVVGIGILLTNRIKAGTVLTASLSASAIFFIITNFAIWLGSPHYTQNIAGLLECYTLALPFLFNGLVGDLFFCILFFGGFYLAQLRFPVLAKAH